ncbi:MAG: hypothetical protein AB2L20_23735 [Mangrovibacterium sp.]
MQYQNMAGSAGILYNCSVCHTVPMNANGHHRNMVNRKDQGAIVQ